MSSLTPEEASALKDFLRDVPLLAELTDDELSRVVAIAHCDEYQSGDRLFRQGDADNTLYLIATGEVRLLLLDVSGVVNYVG